MHSNSNTAMPRTGYDTSERVETITRPTPPRLRWGAILAGTVAALGLWVLLYALGAALGLSAVDPGDDGSVKTASVVSGVWGLVAPLLALFAGGFVAGRVAGPATKLTGSLHGLVLWGITAIGGVWLVSMLVGTVAVGAVDVSKGALKEAVYQLNASDAIGVVNTKLDQSQMPRVTADEVRAASQDVVREAIANGKLDREMLVTALAQQTKLSQADAATVADRVAKQFEDATQRAKVEAQEAADTTGKVFWGVFAALLAGLIASMVGALLAVTREQRVRAEEVVGVAVHPVSHASR